MLLGLTCDFDHLPTAPSQDNAETGPQQADEDKHDFLEQGLVLMLSRLLHTPATTETPSCTIPVSKRLGPWPGRCARVPINSMQEGSRIGFVDGILGR